MATLPVEVRRRHVNKQNTTTTTDEDGNSGEKEWSTSVNWSLHKLWLKEEVPNIFQEPFIVGSYRPPKCSLSECLVGMVWPLHNETWNIWTHLIPGLYFSGLLLYLVFHENSSRFFTSSVGLPMVIFLATAGGYGLLSAAAHLFNTLSMHARHIAFTFDYLAISLYSYGCAAAYRAYSFPRDGESRDDDDDFMVMSYLPMALFLAAASHLVACYTRLAPEPSPIIIHSGRFFAYVAPYLFVTWPVQYRYYAWYFYGDTVGFDKVGVAQHGLHFVFSFLSAFFYLSHIPERFAPGKFDVFGHSHQLFHLCSVAATQFQFDGFLEDFRAKQCVPDELSPSSVAEWPCEPGTTFNSVEALVSPSFLSSSILGLVVHNLMACSLLAAIVVPRVVERQHRHHGHHRSHHSGRYHTRNLRKHQEPVKESSFVNGFLSLIKQLKQNIVRIGSFRHRL